MITSAARVLVVAHRAAPSAALMLTVRERALRGPAEFVLLIPGGTSGVVSVEGPEDVDDPRTKMLLRMALPALRAAARGPVQALVGGQDPVAAVSDAVNFHEIDEVIVSSPTPRMSRWLRVDLARRLEVLGLPVTAVEAPPVTLDVK
ncbi:MAG: hypothetical protein QOG77_2952 [Solirubrobacteraceae bacterium]|jgi:hypothetical protein|nr:hypothetical protein [Solirubrobacteraceae bacterium]